MWVCVKLFFVYELHGEYYGNGQTNQELACHFVQNSYIGCKTIGYTDNKSEIDTAGTVFNTFVDTKQQMQ
jgi:hypothetical protein